MFNGFEAIRPFCIGHVLIPKEYILRAALPNRVVPAGVWPVKQESTCAAEFSVAWCSVATVSDHETASTLTVMN